MTHERQSIPEKEVEIPNFRFSDEAKESLQKRGYTTLALDYSHYRLPNYRFPQEACIVEVAFSPAHIELPIYIGDNTSVPAIPYEKVLKGYESIEKYSEEVSRQIPGCVAIEASAYYGEVNNEYKKLTGKQLPENNPYWMSALIVPSTYRDFQNSLSEEPAFSLPDWFK